MIDLKKEKQRISKLQAVRKVTIDNFPHGSKVRFWFNKAQCLIGKIEVCDYRGGGIYHGMCSSVDIIGDDGVLYKHVPIVDVEILD